MTTTRKMRSPEDHTRFRLALVAVDQAFCALNNGGASGAREAGRPIDPRRVPAGLAAYRQALEAGDPDGLEAIGPKMIQALAVMAAEAEAAGCRPLDVTTWEPACPMGG